MAKSEINPNQIFSSVNLPENWKEAFNKNLELMPGEIRSELENAWRIANETGFPDRKDENWRWMNLKELDFESLLLDINQSPFQLETKYYSNLAEQSELSSELPKGVIVSTWRELLRSNRELAIRFLKEDKLVNEGIFAALVYALANDGVFVYVPRGVMVEGVLQLLIKVDLEKRSAFTRNIVWLEEGSSLNLEFSWLSDDTVESGFKAAVLQAHLGDRANLHFDERQQFSLSEWNISHETAFLGADAQLEWNLAAIGTKLSKNFIKVELEGKGSNAKLNGAMFPTKQQLINLDTRQNHWAEDTMSDLLYKSVASHDGRSIWHGMIYVDPLAQKTDAYQTNNNLILDDSADMKTLPGLEIHADDVKCSHGATVGKVDDEELFYLEARGIGPKDAEKLIVEGFFYQVLQSYKLEKSREEVLNLFLERMDE